MGNPFAPFFAPLPGPPPGAGGTPESSPPEDLGLSGVLVFSKGFQGVFQRGFPKGFSRVIQVFKVNDFISSKHRTQRKILSHTGERVEINVLDSSDIHAAMKELREIQEYLEEQFKENE